MSDRQRYRSGPFSEVKSLIKAGVQADIGDQLFLTNVAGVGKCDTNTSLNTTAALAADKFLGILVQGATKGTESVDTPCLVYTSGEFEMDIAAAGAALPVGTLVSPAAAAGGDQTVLTGAVIADAIGRTSKAIAVGDVTCLVKIESVIFGGPQAAS